MVDYVVNLALKTIGNLLIEEAKFLGSVKDQAELLQGDLGLMQWFLKDAQGKKVDKIRIQEWVNEFREIAYDTEDVLESYAFNIGSRRQGRGVLTILSETWLKHRTGLQFQALHMRISNLKHNFEIYGLRAIMEGGGGSSLSLSGTRQQLRRSYSHVMEADFVGLESDVEMLVQHLVGKQYRFVSICGMGGLGKTTLAQKIYNHPQVKRHFNESCWICISQEWQTIDILQNLLTKIVPNKREEIVKYREDELVRKLFDAQKGKNFIFVLDDAWETNVWESIKHAIHKNSKILLTTRNKGVAIHISPNGFHHQPRLLNEGECLELLQKKAFFIPRNDKDHGITSVG